jgi:hypothetical protein
MHYFGPRLQKWYHTKCVHSTPLDLKWCFGVFWSIFKRSECIKDAKLVYRAWKHYFGVLKCGKWFRTKCIHCTFLIQNDFCDCFGTFVNLSHVKRCKTCVSGVNALLRGTKVAKIISYQMHLFVSVLHHFGDLRNVKRSATCVSGLNALFRGTEVAKIIFGNVL